FRVVDKNIRGAVLGGDKAEALLRVEPLHSSLWHFLFFPFLFFRVRSTVSRYTGPVPTAIPSWSRRNWTRLSTLAGTAIATSFLRVQVHEHRSCDRPLVNHVRGRCDSAGPGMWGTIHSRGRAGRNCAIRAGWAAGGQAVTKTRPDFGR